MSVVVTRMQDLASEFSKIFWGDTPDPHSGTGRPHPAPTPLQPGQWPGLERKRSGVGTQTSIPLNFSAVVAPLPGAWEQWIGIVLRFCCLTEDCCVFRVVQRHVDAVRRQQRVRRQSTLHRQRCDHLSARMQGEPKMPGGRLQRLKSSRTALLSPLFHRRSP